MAMRRTLAPAKGERQEEGVMAMSSRSAWIRHGLLATAAAVLTQPALAQTAPAAPPETPEQAAETGTQDAPPATQDSSNECDVIIVTGTSRARAAFNTPLSVTTLDDERLARLSSSSQGDILNTVPTIKADAGGGEV